MYRPSADSIGERFGSLIVLSMTGRYRNGRAIVLCRCDCGNEKEFNLHGLRDGNTTSCGCLTRELKSKILLKRNTTHGKSHLPENKIWRQMKVRCQNPNDPKYPIYGGRGITVCLEWRHDFVAFLAHIGRRPGPGYSIERIDNSKGYQPGNVRWATKTEQARNTRYNRIIEFKGEKMVLAEWAERTGIPACVLSQRLNRYGWTEERALTEPKHNMPKRRAVNA